jgi:hypothetical protein
MNQSEQINELVSALSKAQGEMDGAVKDSLNPHFKSKYADLASVWQACRDPLSKHGLSIVQTLDLLGEKQVLMTILAHASGQWIKSTIQLPIQRPGPQELGSCLSYCRRYALAAMVGVYQDDDDAESAQKAYSKKEPVINEEQATQIENLLEEIENDKSAEDFILTRASIKSIYEVPRSKFTGVMEYLNKLPKKGVKDGASRVA